MDRSDILRSAYLAAAACTFGWAAADPAHDCPALPDKPCVEFVERPAAGVIAGAFWPLYWIWTFSDKIRSENP